MQLEVGDKIPPKPIFETVVFNDDVGTPTIVLGGQNFASISEPGDIINLLDWTKLSLKVGSESIEFNNTDQQSANSDLISSVILGEDVITISLTASARSELLNLSKFGVAGGNDALMIEDGFTRDPNGNISKSDGTSAEGIALTYQDNDGASSLDVLRFYADDGADGSYGQNAEIPIYAQLSQNVSADSILVVTFNTGETAELIPYSSTGDAQTDTLRGIYTVGSNPVINLPSRLLVSLQISRSRYFWQ